MSENDWVSELLGIEKGTMTVRFTGPPVPLQALRNAAEDELVFHVTDDDVPGDWTVGRRGLTRFNGREVETEIVEAFGDGWFKLRVVPSDDD